MQCQAMFSKLGETCFLPTWENSYKFEASRRLELPKWKKAARDLIKEQYVARAE